MIAYREGLAKNSGYTEIYVGVASEENPKMLMLLISLGYYALSAPYQKNVLYYNEDGKAYTHTYKRIDLKKRLI